MIKVKALRKGWYGTLRDVGDEFDVKNKADVGSWMRVLSEPASTKATAGAIVAAIEESEDVEFLQEQLESEYKTVREAAEKRIEELKG